MSNATPPRLELLNISKRFGDTLANDRVSLRVMPGEIHALLGENGAGKSTLMNLLYGVLQPDGGSILWNNRETVVSDPARARTLGIGMVFQHFSLIERLSIRDNLCLALGEYTLEEIEQRFAQVQQRFGLAVDLSARVVDLSAGQRQRVEILRCLLQDIQLLILDEPTSVLTPDEVYELMALLRDLAEQGCSILFISHKLNEVQALCHRATVLRGGRLAGEVNLESSSLSEITTLMLGAALPETEFAAVETDGDVVLSLRHDAGATLKSAQLCIAAGEIVGIGGVSGSGQDELIDIISGEIPCLGDLRYAGACIKSMGVAVRRSLGIATLPVDRLGRGASPGLNLAENYLLTHSHLRADLGGWFPDWSQYHQHAQRVIDDYQIKAASTSVTASELSGGNLQRFLFGREMARQPRLLACYNPTWGVDPAAAARIHQELVKARDAGAAVLVISEDIDELFRISDRMGALCSGRLSAVLPRAQVSRNLMGEWMTGTLSAEVA